MTVEVELPDGRVVPFPNGTTPDVIERTVRGMTSGSSQQDAAPPRVSMSGHQYSTGHVGEAAAEGFRTAPKIIPQEQLDAANKYPLGYWLTNPLMQAINFPLQAGNAVFRGGQQAVQEALSPINPQLGRDIAAMPEAFFGSKGREAPGLPMRPDYILRNRMMPAEPPPAPRFVGEYYGEPVPGDVPRPIAPQSAPAAPAFAPPGTVQGPTLNRINELIRADENVVANRPDFVPPRTVTDPVSGEVTPVRQPPNPADRGVVAPEQPPGPRTEPGVQPAGAQVTTEPVPAQTATAVQDSFEKSVLQTAEDRAGPGRVDQTVYVPGAQRTEAARVFSEDNSVNDRVLKDTDPEGYGKAANKIENDAKDVLMDDYRRQAGDNYALDQAVEARKAFSPAELGVFEKEIPTTKGQDIVQFFDRLLAGPEGKRKAVRNILEDARDGFLDNSGNPEILPSRLYGGRKNLTDILDEGVGSSTSTRKQSVQAARHFLSEALDEVVDPAINDGAPLFDTFRTKWHELSKPIDRMDFLQQHLFGAGDVRGTDGKIQFSAVQRLLEKMAKLRRAAGNNPVKSFDLEHLDPLVAIRNELAAWHLRDRLHNASGSPTVQRATAAAKLQSGPLGKAISGAADVAGLITAAHMLGPVMGPVAYGTVGRPLVQKVIQMGPAAKLEKTKARMLDTTPRNELMQ